MLPVLTPQFRPLILTPEIGAVSLSPEHITPSWLRRLARPRTNAAVPARLLDQFNVDRDGEGVGDATRRMRLCKPRMIWRTSLSEVSMDVVGPDGAVVEGGGGGVVVGGFVVAGGAVVGGAVVPGADVCPPPGDPLELISRSGGRLGREPLWKKNHKHQRFVNTTHLHDTELSGSYG